MYVKSADATKAISEYNNVSLDGATTRYAVTRTPGHVVVIMWALRVGSGTNMPLSISDLMSRPLARLVLAGKAMRIEVVTSQAAVTQQRQE